MIRFQLFHLGLSSIIFETNTHYNYFRDYEPETGRYLQSDPIGQNGGPNTYGYVNSDPLWYYDDLGLKRKNRWGGSTNGTRNDYTNGGQGKSGIYRIKCADGTTAYIGKTKNFQSRYYAHNHKNGKLNQCSCGNSLFVPDEFIDDPTELHEREVQLIQKERPALNRQHNPDNTGKNRKNLINGKKKSCCGISRGKK